MRNIVGWSNTTRKRKRNNNNMLGIFIMALCAFFFLGSQEGVSAQEGKGVTIEKTGFNSIPDKFFYFKDSNVSEENKKMVFWVGGKKCKKEIRRC